MSAQVPAHLVDRLIELYCEWRSTCWEVRSAYEQFTAATADDRALAYAAYLSALDREESAAGVYADQMTRVASLARHLENSSGTVERRGRRGGSAAAARGG
jgi:hypothetical protein